MKQPPKRLSTLLRLAVSDSMKTAADPQYAFDMFTWHSPNDGICYVCMAGAVMAQTCKLPPGDMVRPADLDNDAWYGALLAINDMRVGHLPAQYFSQRPTKEQRQTFENMLLGAVDSSGRAPWETYQQAADYLESAEL